MPSKEKALSLCQQIAANLQDCIRNFAQLDKNNPNRNSNIKETQAELKFILEFRKKIQG